MELKERFDAFAKKQQIGRKTNAVREFLTKHNSTINAGAHVAKALVSFTAYKTPFALVEGVFNVAHGLASSGAFYSSDYFSTRNGWVMPFADYRINCILSEGLAGLPCNTLGFKYDRVIARMYSLPEGELAVVCNQGADGGTIYVRYMNTKTATDFLVDAALKRLNSKIISLANSTSNDTPTLKLLAEPIDPKPSAALTKLTAHTRNAFELGINRSYLFYGSPGTSKSTLAQSIVHDLGLKTLVYRDEGYTGLDAFFFVVKHFGIECVILDDMDQIDGSNKLLGMLERINKEVKLVIGVVNSMQDFHPAVIRPRRFDEIMLIEAMDKDVVVGILGPLSATYFDKVKSWPVAYINELVARSKLYPDDDLETHYAELGKRVERQLAALKPAASKAEED